jgi:processive 1,2-diacylglycerol beta-glucosyltransferase
VRPPWQVARASLLHVTDVVAQTDPYVANSDFHKPKHLYSWKTLIRCDKEWGAIARTLRSNVDVAVTLYRNGAWAAT